MSQPSVASGGWAVWWPFTIVTVTQRIFLNQQIIHSALYVVNEGANILSILSLLKGTASKKMNHPQFSLERFHQIPHQEFGMVPTEILEDIFVGLVNENEKNLEDLSVYTGCYKQPKVIELLFTLSSHWHLDSSTKYQAVELLDRFMSVHVQNLFRSITESENTSEISVAWATAKQSLMEQFMLYLVSCIRITSKMHSRLHSVKSRKIIRFLSSAGHSFKREDLLRSEMTVLKTLDFNLNIQSPLTFVETLLEGLGCSDYSLPLRNIRDMCVKILDLVYVLRDQIYETVLRVTVDHSTPTTTQRSEFLPIKEDLMLLATGVIAASCFLINQSSFNKVVENLGNITGITVKSVSDMCSAILKHSMEVDLEAVENWYISGQTQQQAG
ncbi:cyclin N-terminal domain-containing protein 1 [Gastrophryne carolinensis]